MLFDIWGLGSLTLATFLCLYGQATINSAQIGPDLASCIRAMHACQTRFCSIKKLAGVSALLKLLPFFLYSPFSLCNKED